MSFITKKKYQEDTMPENWGGIFVEVNLVYNVINLPDVVAQVSMVPQKM